MSRSATLNGYKPAQLEGSPSAGARVCFCGMTTEELHHQEINFFTFGADGKDVYT